MYCLLRKRTKLKILSVLSEKVGPVFRGKNYAIVLSPNIFELALLLQYLAYYFGNAVIRSI